MIIAIRESLVSGRESGGEAAGSSWAAIMGATAERPVRSPGIVVVGSR